MTDVSKGDTVRFHYVGKLKDGTVFVDTRDKEPVEIKVGESDLIPALEDALIGMEPEETKVIELPPEKAYGPRREALVLKVGHDQLPEGLQPTVGQRLQLKPAGLDPIAATITDVAEKTVTVDANHPLAGMDLVVELQLLSVD
jgi:FKBP-type peptidyl-prolyl cis-trans isomerase 2